MLTHQSPNPNAPILQWHGRARRNPPCCALALCSPAKARIRVWLWPGLADPLASRSPSSPSAWRLPASGAHHWTTPTRALAAAPAATGQRAPQKNTPGRVGRSIGNFGRPRDKAIPTRRRRARSAPSRSARASHHSHQPHHPTPPCCLPPAGRFLWLGLPARAPRRLVHPNAICAATRLPLPITVSAPTSPPVPVGVRAISNSLHHDNVAQAKLIATGGEGRIVLRFFPRTRRDIHYRPTTSLADPAPPQPLFSAGAEAEASHPGDSPLPFLRAPSASLSPHPTRWSAHAASPTARCCAA
jgi:hypothetical protein